MKRKSIVLTILIAFMLMEVGCSFPLSHKQDSSENSGLAQVGTETTSTPALEVVTTTPANLEPTTDFVEGPSITPEPIVTSEPETMATTTPESTLEPVATSTPEPTAISIPELIVTSTPEPAETSTPEPVATSTPEPTATSIPEPTATSTPKPTATNTPTPTATNTPRPTATNTPTPTATNTPRPTATSTPTPTSIVAGDDQATQIVRSLVGKEVSYDYLREQGYILNFNIWDCDTEYKALNRRDKVAMIYGNDHMECFHGPEWMENYSQENNRYWCGYEIDYGDSGWRGNYLVICWKERTVAAGDDQATAIVKKLSCKEALSSSELSEQGYVLVYNTSSYDPEYKTLAKRRKTAMIYDCSQVKGFHSPEWMENFAKENQLNVYGFEIDYDASGWLDNSLVICWKERSFVAGDEKATAILKNQLNKASLTRDELRAQGYVIVDNITTNDPKYKELVSRSKTAMIYDCSQAIGFHSPEWMENYAKENQLNVYGFEIDYEASGWLGSRFVICWKERSFVAGDEKATAILKNQLSKKALTRDELQAQGYVIVENKSSYDPKYKALVSRSKTAMIYDCSQAVGFHSPEWMENYAKENQLNVYGFEMDYDASGWLGNSLVICWKERNIVAGDEKATEIAISLLGKVAASYSELADQGCDSFVTSVRSWDDVEKGLASKGKTVVSYSCDLLDLFHSPEWMEKYYSDNKLYWSGFEIDYELSGWRGDYLVICWKERTLDPIGYFGLAENEERFGEWNLTYMEFIEMYKSIGTDNDLFKAMLKEKGPSHSKGYEFDGVANLEITFESVTAEKLYALHYAPFEYNHNDLVTGHWGKSIQEVFDDHGGVCSMLAEGYYVFLYEVLGETNWEYALFRTEEPGHEVLLVKTEDGKICQIDNCGVDWWWLGLNFTPDRSTQEEIVSAEAAEQFECWKKEFDTLEKIYWHTFSFTTRYDWGLNKWLVRPVWYDFEKKEYVSYLDETMPTKWVVRYTGLQDKVISMAGNYKEEGYERLENIVFSHELSIRF